MATDDATVSLNLDASGYLRSAEQVAKSNRNMSASFEGVTGVTSAVSQGIEEVLNTVVKTEKAFNRFGDVVTTITKSIEGDIVSVKESVNVLNAAFEEQLAIRNKIRAAEKRGAQDAARLQTRGLIERTSSTRPGSTDLEQRAIKDSTDALLRLQDVAGITGQEIFAALERARAGAINYFNANTQLEKQAFALAQAERAAGGALVDTAAKQRAAAIAADTATLANERLAVSRRQLNTNLLSGAISPDAPNVSEGERSQFTASRRSILSLATTAEKIVEIESAVLRAKAGTLTLANAFEDVDRAAVRFAETSAKLGASEEARNRKAKTAADLTARALEKQRLKTEEIETARNKLRDSLQLVPSRDKITDEEFKKFTRKEETFLGDVTDKASGDEALRVLEEARNGTLRLLDANTKLKRDALELAQAERDLGKAFRDNIVDIEAKEKADREALAINDERIIAAKLLNDTIRQQFDIEKPGATSGEQSQFESARKALVGLAESGKVAGSTIEAALERAISGTLTLGNTADATEEAVDRLATAGNKLGSGAAEKEAAALKKTADLRQAEIKALREKAQIQFEIKSVEEAGRRNVNFGLGSEAEIKNFIRAEKAALELAAAGKIVGVEFEAALLKARKGTIDLTKQLTNAETAALEVAAAQQQIGAAGRAPGKGNAFTRLLGKGADLAKVTGIGLFIGNVFRLQGAIEESIADASELSRKLAEIDTIQTTNALSTNAWADSLRKLSNEFGIDTVDQAEAAYQTLSNQVAQGAEAITFLGAANRLAVTGLTDASNSVKLLSSAVTAFRLPVGDADTIAAKFFTTVELGRVRIEELADIFGRVAVPANQLGITLEEVQAGIATLSVQGIKAEESVTLLRNIIQKLIRPGDKLKSVLSEMGFATGQAAIQTLGFGGVLAELETRAGGNVEAVGELFQRIRAISGVLGFAGDSAKQYAKNLDLIQKSNVNDFAQDTNKILKSSGQILKIASQEAKNFFEKAIGTPAIDALAELVTGLGGAEVALNKTIGAARILGSAAVMGLLISKMLAAQAAAREAAEAQKVFAATVTATATAIQKLTTGVTLLGAAFIIYSQIVKASSEKNLALIERQVGDVAKSVAQANKSAIESASTTGGKIEKINKDAQRAFGRNLAARRAVLSKQAQDAEVTAKLVAANFKTANKAIQKNITDIIKSQADLFKTSDKNAKAAAKGIIDSLSKLDTVSLDIDLRVANPKQQLKFIQDQVQQATTRANEAAASGDLDIFNAQIKQANALGQQKLNVEIKTNKTKDALLDKQFDLEQKLEDEKDEKKKKALKDQIADVKERQSLVESLTSAELDGLERLQKARRKLKEASGFTERAQAEKQLKAVEAQQLRINASVQKERDLRKQLLTEQIKQADKLQDIQKINVKRAIQAEKQRAELENARSLLALISEESKTFSESQVLGGKNAAEIVKQVAQQQERFAQIIALQERIGLSGGSTEIFQKKAAGLQERAQIALNLLKADADALQLKAVRERATAEAITIAKGSKLDRQRVNDLAEALSKLEISLTKTIDIATLNGSRENQATQLGKRARLALGSPNELVTRVSPRKGVAFRDPAIGNLIKSLPLKETAERFIDLQVATARLRDAVKASSNSTILDDKKRLALAEEAAKQGRVVAEITTSLIASIRRARAAGEGKGTEVFEEALLRVQRTQREGIASGTRIGQGISLSQELTQQLGLLEQQSITKSGIVAKKEEISETQKHVAAIKDSESALRVFADVLKRVSEGKAVQAPGLAPIPLVNLDADIQNVFTNGGDTVADFIRNAFLFSAAAIRKAIALGGAEAGKAQANAQVDQLAARKRQALAEIAADQAARQKALDDARKAKDKGETFVDANGNFIGRGGGQGIGASGGDAFGLLVGRNTPLKDTDQGKRLAAAVAKQDSINKALDAFQAQQAAKGPKTGQFDGEFEAQAALRRARGDLSLPKVKGQAEALSEIAGARERGIADRAAAQLEGLRNNAPASGGRFPEAPSAERASLEAMISRLEEVIDREVAKGIFPSGTLQRSGKALELLTPSEAKLELVLTTLADRVARLDELNKKELEAKEQLAAKAAAKAQEPKAKIPTPNVSLVTEEDTKLRTGKKLLTETVNGVAISLDRIGGAALTLAQRLDALALAGNLNAQDIGRRAFTAQRPPTTKGVTEVGQPRTTTTNNDNSNIKITVVTPDPAKSGAAIDNTLRTKRLQGKGN